MSIKALNWTKRRTAGGPVAKALLLVLADCADDSGQCWPGQETLASILECSVRCICDAFKLLEGRGLIYRTRRCRQNGSRTSDLIQLCLDKSPENPPEKSAAKSKPNGRSRHSFRQDVPGHNLSEEPINPLTPFPDKSGVEPDAASIALKKENSERPGKGALPFEPFGEAWPWKPDDDRTGARREFEKLSHDDRTTALTRIPAFLEWMRSDAGRPVQAKTYLRRQLWKNQCNRGRNIAIADRGRIFVEKGTSAWRACAERWRLEHCGRSPPTRQRESDLAIGWDFPADWLEVRGDPP